MSNKPKIYANCKAGCLWETVHKSDFDKAASIIKVYPYGDNYAVEPSLPLKVKVNDIKGLKELTINQSYNDVIMTSAMVGTKVYLFSSSSYGYLNAIQVFDEETESINTLSATLLTAVNGVKACAVGTKIYLFGGSVSGALQNTIQVLDTVEETVSNLSTTLPTAAAGIATAAVGTKIYLFGGDTESYINTIQEFDTVTNNIRTLSATLPTVATNITACAVGTKIYLFGGYNGSCQNTIQEFDAETETISTLSAVLPTAAQSIKTAAVGTKIYLFGGAKSGNSLDTILSFDTTTKTISTLSVKLPTSVLHPAAESFGTKIYLFGDNSTTSTTNKIWLFNAECYEISLTYQENGTQKEFYFDLYGVEVDEYRKELKFEILDLKCEPEDGYIDSFYYDITIVYETNGERKTATINGVELSIENSLLTVTGEAVEEVFIINTNAEIMGVQGEKGDTGAAIVSTELQGQDENGGNVYLQTFDDGSTATFTAPKGEKGDTGEITVDSELSTTSTNPVQNKTIVEYVKSYVDNAIAENITNVLTTEV